MYLNNKINKNLEIKIMNDSIHPFCPLSKNKLFNNKNDFLILLEKFQQWLYIYKIINSNINNININTVIKSLIYLCNNNYKINNDDNFYYHHLILFTLSYPNIDLNYLKNSSHLKFYISLFYPSNLMYKNIPFINNIFIYNIQILEEVFGVFVAFYYTECRSLLVCIRMLICPSLKSAFDAKKGTGTDKWIHLHLSIKLIPFFIRIYRDYRPISGRSLSFMRYVGNKTAIPRVD